MARDVAVQNTSAIMADDEEAVEHGEGDRGNREEIHRGNGFPMVTQKSEPTLGWVWISRGSFHPAGNGSFGDAKTEHEKFSVDARSSPARVLGHPMKYAIERRPLFPLGKLVATLGALAALQKAGESPAEFLAMHVRGQWGVFLRKIAGRTSTACSPKEERLIWLV